jgi:lysozyme
MNISQVCVNLIKSFEGLKLKAYKPVPTELYWTIGYGHYGSDVREHDVWTNQKAEDMLKQDLKSYAYSVTQNVEHEINQNQFDALVSFCYNVGKEALRTSTLLKKINDGDITGASEEFEKWVHGGGKVLPGLVIRRKAEKALFLKPVLSAVYYVVKSGDNLTKIANKYKTSIDKIKGLNKSIKDEDKIYAGQKIRVK